MRKGSLFQRKYVFLITIFIISAFCVHAENPAELEKTIPSLMKKAMIPGLSIAVIEDGKIVWDEGFGIKNVKTDEPANKDTIFEAASLTKPLFAYAVLRMVDEGVLELDIPLIEYLPQGVIETGLLRHPLDLEGFKADWFEKITARHALSHSSGMPHGERGKPYPLFFEPGEKYKYSAQGYWYLQLVVEHLKDQKLEHLIKDYVLDPLEMNASSMVWRDEYEDTAAVGHDLLSETTGRFRKRTRAHAAASLYTTAQDYAKFVTAVMNGDGLKKETAGEMLFPQIKMDEDVFWSLGFGIQNTAEGSAFWQWGDYGIFRNYITAIWKQKHGFVYFTNSYNGLSIGKEIVKRVLDVEDLAIASLGYDQYDSPQMMFTQLVIDQGIGAAEKMMPELIEKFPPNEIEAGINSLGYAFLNANKHDNAIDVFKLNVEHFPRSANVYDSLAEAYMKSGENELAIKYYKKTLEAIPDDPRPDKDFLERLKKGALENIAKLEKEKK
jgi:CubicO group peptidase (beta-lactamase class C family)